MHLVSVGLTQKLHRIPHTRITTFPKEQYAIIIVSRHLKASSLAMLCCAAVSLHRRACHLDLCRRSASSFLQVAGH